MFDNYIYGCKGTAKNLNFLIICRKFSILRKYLTQKHGIIWRSGIKSLILQPKIGNEYEK